MWHATPMRDAMGDHNLHVARVRPCSLGDRCSSRGEAQRGFCMQVAISRAKSTKMWGCTGQGGMTAHVRDCNGHALRQAECCAHVRHVSATRLLDQIYPSSTIHQSASTHL
eukprot:8458350-Pyramimonas_sp.AAC.1